MLSDSEVESPHVGSFDPDKWITRGRVDRQSLINVFGDQIEQGNPMSIAGKPKRVVPGTSADVCNGQPGSLRQILFDDPLRADEFQFAPAAQEALAFALSIVMCRNSIHSAPS